MRKRIEFRCDVLEKSLKDRLVIDIGHAEEEHHEIWAVFLDKGYLGIDEQYTEQYAIKETTEVSAYFSDRYEKEKKSGDRNIVENFYGRPVWYKRTQHWSS